MVIRDSAYAFQVVFIEKGKKSLKRALSKLVEEDILEVVPHTNGIGRFMFRDRTTDYHDFYLVYESWPLPLNAFSGEKLTALTPRKAGDKEQLRKYAKEFKEMLSSFPGIRV